MLKGLLGFFPIFLFELNFRFHQHENGVVTDAEVLSKGLLEEIVSSSHISSITVDDSGQDMSFYDSLIFLKTVINLSQSPWSIVKQPASLS